METTPTPAKWLRLLFYVSLASFLKSLLAYLPFIRFPGLISQIITLCKILCLFCLVPHALRFRKAAIFRAITLVCALLGSLPLVAAGTVFSIVAAYQEYHAHAELIAEKDTVLARRWCNLFHWDWSITLLISLISSIVTVILMYPNPRADASHISAITNSLLTLFSRVLDLVYLLYLKKTIQHFQKAFPPGEGGTAKP